MTFLCFRQPAESADASLQNTGTPCLRSVTGFCRCFAFRIGKIRDHNGIIRNFQFRKFLPVKSNHKSFHGRYFINLQINVASSKQARLPSMLSRLNTSTGSRPASSRNRTSTCTRRGLLPLWQRTGEIPGGSTLIRGAGFLLARG